MQMDTTLPAFQPEDLLAHRDFVRGLAIHLVRDPDRAADAEQETWLRAMESPPRHGGNVRAWLGTVLRNVVRQTGRGGARRTAREQTVARPGGVVPAAAVAAREEIRQRVVDAVQQLDEPYRSAVLWRHYHDLPPREIAARLEIPVETVKTRIKRGLAMLRERLDAEHGGGRAAWCSALLLLVSAPSADAGTAGPALAVRGTRAAGWWLAGALLLSLTGALGWWGLRSGGDGSPTAEAGTEVAAARASSEPSGSTPSSSSATTAGTTPAPAANAAEPALRPLAVEDTTGRPGAGGLRVRVQDATGAPVAGALVGLGAAHATPAPAGFGGYPARRWVNRSSARVLPICVPATTDADGVAQLRIEFAGTADSYTDDVWIAAPGHAARYLSSVAAQAGIERDLGTVVLPAGRELHGTVTDPGGAPVAGARVVADVLYRKGMPWHTSAPEWVHRPTATTAADGTYVLQHVRHGEVWLRAHVPGFAAGSKNGDRFATGPLDIALQSGCTVRGRVTGAAPRPALRVQTDSGQDPAVVAADGTFVLRDLPQQHVALELCDASGRGWGETYILVRPDGEPVSIELVRPDTDDLAPDDEPDDDPDVELHGSVRDAATGAPITRFAFAVQSEITEEGDAEPTRHVWSTEQAHARGHFRTLYLAPGTHTFWVRARGYLPATQRVVLTAGVPLGPLEFHLRRGTNTIAGVVRRRADGRAVEGAWVAIVHVTDDPEPGEAPDPDLVEPTPLHAAVRTDAAGRFTLRFAPSDPVTLLVRGERGEIAARLVPGVQAGGHPLVIDVDSRLVLRGRIELAAPGTPGADIRVVATPVRADRGDFSMAGIEFTDDTGGFSIGGLAPGRYHLDAFTHAGVQIMSGVQVQVSHGMDPVTLRAAPPSTLLVRLELPAALSNDTVWAAPVGQAASTGHGPDAGTKVVRIYPIAAGRWYAKIEGWGHFPIYVEAAVAAGETTTVVLQPTAGQVALELRDADGAPYARPVRLIRLDSPARDHPLDPRARREALLQPGADGRITAYQVEAGTYLVRDYRGNGARSAEFLCTGGADRHTVVLRKRD